MHQARTSVLLRLRRLRLRRVGAAPGPPADDERRLRDCIDTDDGATDPYGTDCEYYDGTPGDCGGYDDTDFSSIVMCCACGGGSVSASPTTLAPSFTESPSTSSAPTGEPEQATTCGRMRQFIGALADGGRLVMQIVNDITCQSYIEFEGDLSVRAFGDAAASRPAVSGGGATRLFAVWWGATLELDHIALVNGFAQDQGTYFSDDNTRGGLLLVYDATLILRGCVLLHGYSDYYVREVRAACCVGEKPCRRRRRARRARASRAGLTRGKRGVARARPSYNNPSLTLTPTEPAPCSFARPSQRASRVRIAPRSRRGRAGGLRRLPRDRAARCTSA